MTDIHEQIQKTRAVISKSEQLEIFVEFEKCVDLWISNLEIYAEEYQKNKKNLLNDSLRSKKLEREIHDTKIELNKETKDFVDNEVNELWDKLSRYEKSILNRPRLFGFFLLVLGNKALNLTKKGENHHNA